MILGAHILEAMFFTGLVGCAAVVVISWISIFKSGFSDKDNQRPTSGSASPNASKQISRGLLDSGIDAGF